MAVDLTGISPAAGGGGLLNRTGATTLPTAADDEGKGYSAGSMWITVAGAIYVCFDATEGAARWVGSPRVGKTEICFEAAEPDGWLFANGQTIGDAASGADHANADARLLFEYYWNNIDNTDLPIQDSSGAPTTRGANAAADWAAHKRLPVEDMRGLLPLGKDDMGGVGANRVSSAEADTLGAMSGGETHSLTQDEMPAHAHTMPSVLRYTGSGYAYGGQTLALATASATGSAGGGQAHDNMPPYRTVNYLIKL